MKRRKFVTQVAAGTAAFTVIPRQVLGGKGFVAPSDRINLGFIGNGKQSYTLLENIGNCPETVVIAASDVFGAKLDLFIQAAEKKNAGKVKTKVKGYHYYRELLERKDIDAVVIASPDHWHAQMVVDAAKAGKDIYCEKPLSLTIAEGRAMVNAVRKYDRVFQTGNMQRSWRDFRHACELVYNGYIGQVKEVNVSVGEPVKHCDLPTEPVPDTLDWNEWVGPSLYQGYNTIFAPPVGDNRWAWWRGYRHFGGGFITDWGAHMFDIAQWALGMDDSGPVAYYPPEEPAKTGLYYKYANGVIVNHKEWGEHNAVQFIGTEGKVEVSREFLRTTPEHLATMKMKSTDKRLYYSDNHYQNWIDSIKTRSKPVSDVEIGHRTASVCNGINIAYELQRPLIWDPKKEQFEDEFANNMVSRAYRGKWDYTDF